MFFILLGATLSLKWNWTKFGKFTSVRTIGNHRRYNQNEIYSKLGLAEEKCTVCYSRVSANDQKEDLKRQAEELEQYCKDNQIEKVIGIKEVGSGLNYKKRGFLKLLKLLLNGRVERVIISYKDRLMRFGNEIIEEICRQKRISIVILNEKPAMSFEEKLSKDIISILTVFCAKIYGKRSHERRKKRLQV